MLMLVISCIWCLALLCHLLSLDMLCVYATCLVSKYHMCELCNAILLQDIIYVNYAMPCCLAKHHICELYHAILLLYYVFHLSIMFVHSTTLPVHQSFEEVMEVSGVKTRYSEQTMLPAEADILRVIDSSSEEDSETYDQSYSPPEVYAQTWQGYITHIMRMLYIAHTLIWLPVSIVLSNRK